MYSISALKTILATIVSTTIVSSAIASPVKANESFDFSQDIYTYSDRPENDSPADNFNQIIGITGLIIGTGAIAWHLTKAYKPSLVNSVSPSNNTSLLTHVNPKLRQELLRLVHNRQTANRLLSGTLAIHPGRSPNWLAEKVIYDLKRDRA